MDTDPSTMLRTSLLKRLLARDEGQFLEFKSAYERPGGVSLKRRKATEVAWDIAEALSAMANADGGTLLLGVEDDKTVTGVDHPDDKLALFRQATQNLLRPPLRARLTELDHEGQRVLAFEVDPSPLPHQLTDGRYLLRVRDQNMPFPADQIAALKSAKDSGQYERQFVHEARFEDLDLDLLAQFTQRLGDPRPVEEILYRDYRLIDFHNGRPRLTLAALLLFARDPLRWHPRCGVDFVKFEGTERRYGPELNVVRRARIEHPLFRLLDEAFVLIREHVRDRTVQHGDTFTNRACQKASGVDRDLAYREIQEMIRLGIVTRPSGRYDRTYLVVEPAGTRLLPDDLTPILDILSTQGYVTNLDLREAWGVARATAWKRAKELVAEGFLRQEGEKRGTRYYPTDKLQDVLRNA